MELTFTLHDVYGWAAAALTLLAFSCTHIVRLRYVALGANFAFIAYGFNAELWPVLALHAVLVPVNLWRLQQAMQSEAKNAPARPTPTPGLIDDAALEPGRHA